MISEASSTSLKMSTPTPSMRITSLRSRRADLCPSLDGQHAFGGVLVEVAEERVATGLERPHKNNHGRVCRHDLLPVELVALKFLGCRVQILDFELDLLPRRHDQLGGLET